MRSHKPLHIRHLARQPTPAARRLLANSREGRQSAPPGRPLQGAGWSWVAADHQAGERVRAPKRSRRTSTAPEVAAGVRQACAQHNRGERGRGFGADLRRGHIAQVVAVKYDTGQHENRSRPPGPATRLRGRGELLVTPTAVAALQSLRRSASYQRSHAAGSRCQHHRRRITRCRSLWRERPWPSCTIWR